MRGQVACSSSRGQSLAFRPASPAGPQRFFHGRPSLRSSSNGSSFVCHAQWLECSANIDVEVPLELAWNIWEDKEKIPEFMGWITEVKVQAHDKALSRWKLETEQFNRKWSLTWLARNLAPIRYQKIHWRSVPGSTSIGIDVANRGEIRFARRASGCNVRLSFSYEVPELLVPFAGALTPLVESRLQQDMRNFREYALKKKASLEVGGRAA